MAPKLDELSLDELRERAKDQGISGIWDMRKEELIDALEGDGGRSGGDDEGRSAPSEKEVSSTDERADYDGQTLWTRNHDVIKQWAQERDAKPVTVPDTGPDDRAGVLRLDFPGYGGGDLEEISWDEWFEPFDERNLRFIYQERKKDGSQSNFFRLENPDREDA